ncbi:MAG: hypothetical protein KAY37_17350 [Phycisphaerae bacterium]|nr:hypothetical protein [Phycisphaerae bacterium]
MPPADCDPHHPQTRHDLLALAEQAARAGGQVAQRHFGLDLGVRLKADRSEVSAADEAAQNAVIAHIQAHRHADAFIVEESLELPDLPSPTNDRLCWVIDPLDGTRNFVRNVPFYTCSVAAMIDGLPLVGAIYDPEREMLYSATRTEGLFINGKLQPTRDENTARTRGLNPRPVVAIPSTPRGVTRALALTWLDRFVCRCLGSTALHLALVAGGGFNGMLADNPRLWDIAAGWVLITATGGKLTSPSGDPVFPLDVAAYTDEELPTLAAHAAVYDQLLGR